MQHASTSYNVRVLDKAFEILSALAGEKSEIGVSELARKLGHHKSTVHRLLAVLERNGCVEQVPATAKYRLGWKLYELGLRAAAGHDLCELARPHLRGLMEETGETAHLGVLRQGEVVSLVNAESERTVRAPATVGRRSPAHCTSVGKAMLAFLPPEEIREFLRTCELKPLTARTITEASKLKSELATVRRNGYAVDREEFEEGLMCVGAPVRDCTGKVVAAVSVAGPVFRFRGAAVRRLARSVMKTCGQLSSALGYRPEALRCQGGSR